MTEASLYDISAWDETRILNKSQTESSHSDLEIGESREGRSEKKYVIRIYPESPLTELRQRGHIYL